jgi:hypothetical protein
VTSQAAASPVPIAVVSGLQEPLPRPSSAPGTEYAEDFSGPLAGEDQLAVTGFWTVGRLGRQAIFERDADGLSFRIDLRAAAASSWSDRMLRLTLQIVNLQANTVAGLHSLSLDPIPRQGNLSVILGKALATKGTELTTAAWWGLPGGLYLSRAVLEVPNLRIVASTRDIVFRVDDGPQ